MSSTFPLKAYVQFAKALEKCGREYELVYIEDKVEHAFNALYPTWEASIRVNKKMVEFRK